MPIDSETGEVKFPFLRTPFNYDMNQAGDESGLDCGQDTKTQQHFKEECDINTIWKRFVNTGAFPEQPPRFPEYVDFTDAVVDFHTAANIVRQAEEAFMEVPAEIRARFQNDPGQLLDFVHNPANRPEAEQLGLVPKHTPVTQAAAAPAAGGEASGAPPEGGQTS